MNNKNFLARYGDDSHVNSILSGDLNYSSRDSVAKNPTISSNVIHKLIDSGFYNPKTSLTKHPNFDSSHVDKLIEKPSDLNFTDLPQYEKLQSQHIDKIISIGEPFTLHDLSTRRDLKSDHIDKIMATPNLIHGTVHTLASHGSTSKDALNKIIANGHPDHATVALMHPKLTLSDLKHHAENHPNEKVRQAARNYHEMFSDDLLKESVNSDEFKSWFGKSTLHTDGKPTTFYHGTSSDVTSFKSGGGNQWGHGHYFIKSPKIAAQYATGTTTGAHSRIAPEGNAAPNIMPVHLRMENPFIMDAPLTKETHKKIENHLGDSLKDYFWKGMKNRDLHQILHQGFVHGVDAANGVLKRAGYDGIRETSDESIHMVFDPHQIKSAIGNRGKYSKTSSDITESFDSQLPKTEIPKDSMLHQMGSMSAAMLGGDNFKMYKLDKAGYMIQFDKDGATELHHVDDDLQGGYLRSKQPSMRMISTYRGVVKDLLDKGSKVRLVAHHTLADKFASITKRIVDKNTEYKMSEPVETQHEITGDKLKSWELSKF